MMHFDLVLAGGDILLPAPLRSQPNLAMFDGKFAAILAPGSAVSVRERLEIRGLTVSSGVVDAHLHLGHGIDIFAATRGR
jgi:dihydropyrimidinase